MQQILFIHSTNTVATQELLKNGWRVVNIYPVSQHVSTSTGGNYSSIDHREGTFGAYVVLEKD